MSTSLSLFFLAAAGIFSCVSGSDGEAVIQLNASSFDQLIGKETPVFVEFYAPWCGHCKVLAPELEKAAQTFRKYPTKIKIAAINADKYSDIADRFGITSFPVLKYFDANSVIGEPYNGGRTAQDIIDYLNVKTGLQGKSRSSQSRVVELNSKNFDQVVFDDTKHVFVEFYAPWCGHCKQLAPIYESIAAAFADEPQCVIARIDADANREFNDKYQVTGFPAFRFFSKSNKKPDEYTKARDEQAMIRYLNEKCGATRAPGGRFTPDIGRTIMLDALTTDFMNSDIIERTTILERIAASNEPEAKYYAKVMKRVMSEGDVFVALETERLTNMLKNEVLSPAQISGISRRLNVLDSFIEAIELDDQIKGDGLELEG